MGSTGSKEDVEAEGLRAKYARGISSSEFLQNWRNNINYKDLQERLAKKNLSKSCISICGDKLFESDPSVMLLSKSKLSNAPPRLQSIGVKQKSYVNQLIEHRSKFNVMVNNNKKPQQKTTKEEKNLKDNIVSCDLVSMKNVIKNGGQFINKQNVSITNDYAESFIHLNFDEPKKKNKQNKEDDSSSSEKTTSRPNSPSWTSSNSEESSLEGNISVGDGLEHIRSDMTVVPYVQAKARFELGTHKKRLKKNEDYDQLEQLGLGFWNNDQWVPTKVVTLAISDQLSCAGGDWPANYRYRRNYNCQSFRTSFSEVQH